MDFDAVILTFAATLRLATPLIFCAMAGLLSERSGIVDIGLEGKMLAGAFAAAAVASLTGSVWLGLVAAIAISVFIALIHGYACITQKGNQVVSGVAVNILASGLAIVAGTALFNQGGQTPSLPKEARFLSLNWPGAVAMEQVPVLGPIYAHLISGHNLLVYVALLTVPLTHWLVNETRFGLRLRAVGEKPEAADTAGISVAWLRYRAVLLCGLLTGFAGAYLSTAQNAAFTRDMTAGQGFIALAAMIFGKWRPWPTLGACLLFGLLDAIAIRLQGVKVFGTIQVPVQLVQASPYILTVLLLAGFIGKAVAPKASGIPYVKER
ncbi:MAG TPA: ABC transporter permease [Terriglobia bacterium]|nr:ABC transporter permease [Terriglobia bacterium]